MSLYTQCLFTGPLRFYHVIYVKPTTFRDLKFPPAIQKDSFLTTVTLGPLLSLHSVDPIFSSLNS